MCHNFHCNQKWFHHSNQRWNIELCKTCLVLLAVSKMQLQKKIATCIFAVFFINNIVVEYSARRLLQLFWMFFSWHVLVDANWFVSSMISLCQVLRHVSLQGSPPPKVWWVPPTGLHTALRLALRHLNIDMVSVYCFWRVGSRCSLQIAVEGSWYVLAEMDSLCRPQYGNGL